MRCDLHVHTVHSGMCTLPLLSRICRECYTPPLALFERLRQLGMGLVTVTDHDSIDAAEELRKYPEFFLSEEVTVILPSGTEAHVGIYDITDRQHIEVQARRDDAPRFFAYLQEQGILSSINHLLSALTGRRAKADFAFVAAAASAIETKNGAMPNRTNTAAAEFAAWTGKARIGGSDSHALRSAGRAFTEVKHARNKFEFLQGVRSGAASIGGADGGYWLLNREVLSIVRSLLRERPAVLPLIPLLAALPVVLLFNYGQELAFSSVWRSRLAVDAARLPIPELIA